MAKIRPKVVAQDFVTPARIKLENNALFGAVIFLPLILSALLGWFIWQFDPAESDSLSFFSASSSGLITIAVFAPTAYGIIVSNSALRLSRGRLLRAWPVGVFTFIFGASLLVALSVSLIGATGWQLQPQWLDEHFVKVMLATTILMALWVACLMYLTIRQVSSRVSTNYVVLWTLDPRTNNPKKRLLVTELRDLALTSADVADMNRNDVRDRLRGLASIMAEILKYPDLVDIQKHIALVDIQKHIANEYAVAGQHVASDEVLAGDWLTYLNLVLNQTGIWAQHSNEHSPKPNNDVVSLLRDGVIEMSVRCLKSNNRKFYNVVKRETWPLWVHDELKSDSDSTAFEIDRTDKLLEKLFEKAERFPDLEKDLLDDDLLKEIIVKRIKQPKDIDAQKVEILLMNLAKKYGESPRLGYIWGEVVTSANKCLTKELQFTKDPRAQMLQPTPRLFNRMGAVFQSPTPDDKWILATKVALNAIKGIPLEKIPHEEATEVLAKYYIEGKKRPFLQDKCDGDIGKEIRIILNYKCTNANWAGNGAFMELTLPLLMSRSRSGIYSEKQKEADLLSACWLTHIAHYDKQLLTTTIKKLATKKSVYILRLIEIAESLEQLSVAKPHKCLEDPDLPVLYGFDIRTARETIDHLLAEVIGNPDPLQLPDFEKNVLSSVIMFLCSKRHRRDSIFVKSLVVSLREIEFSRKARAFVAVFDHFNTFLENSETEKFEINIQKLYEEHNCFELGEYLSDIADAFKEPTKKEIARYLEACIEHMWKIKSLAGMSQLSYQFLRLNYSSLLSNKEVSAIATTRLQTLREVISSWSNDEKDYFWKIKGALDYGKLGESRNPEIIELRFLIKNLLSTTDKPVVSPTENELDVPNGSGS